MTAPATERVIRDLAETLKPVRRIPRLRTVLAVAGLLWLATAIPQLAGMGVRDDLRQLLMGNLPFVAILTGLALAAVGGVVGTLGASVPGRTGVERIGQGLTLAGALLAGAIGPGLLLAGIGAGASAPLGRDLRCLLAAGWIGVPPGLVVAWFAWRAAPHRPAAALAWGIAGAVALGALVVHPTCPLGGARHWIVAHALAPLLGALLAAPLAAWGFRRRARSR